METRRFAVLVLVLAALAACGTPAPEQAPQVLHVQYTLGTRPWLAELYACAERLPGVVLRVEQRPAVSLEPGSADLSLRLGAPPRMTAPAYSLGEEELLIIVHPGNLLPSLTTAQAAGLFSGRIRNWKEVGGADLPVQLWAFNDGEDIQQVFNAAILHGSPIPPLARQAQDTEEMAAGVASDPAAIGLLPRRSLSSSVRPVPVEAATLVAPVLASLQDEPQGSAISLIGCLQE